jgi:soluble lytic murein transglycosylase-like protein
MKGILPLLLVIGVLAAAFYLIPGTHTVAHQSGTYVQMARADAQEAGIDPNIFERQIRMESGFQPNVVSHAGAIGIAQFMPDTARRLGINPYDPAQSLRGAAQLMGRYVRGYGSVNWANRYAWALAAYNAGPGTINRCTQTHNWYVCLPGETQRYIAVILQW